MYRQKKIWVVLPWCSKENIGHIKQLICKAASFVSKVDAVVELIYIYKETPIFLEHLGQYVEHIYMVKAEDSCNVHLYTETLAKMALEKHADLIMFPATCKGRELAGRLATCIGAGFLADCIDIDFSEKHGFLFYRPALSQTIIAEIAICNTSVSICTIRNNIFEEISKFHKNHETVCMENIDFKVPFKIAKKNLIKSEKILELDEELLRDSKLVFCAGKGIGSINTFELLKKVAKKANAAIGGTRHIIEKGWLNKSYQIGQTGEIICPEIYVAFGVSGALQHMAGVKNAKKIIAVNIDKNAPIFQFADYMIIEDAAKILKEMDKQLIDKNL